MTIRNLVLSLSWGVADSAEALSFMVQPSRPRCGMFQILCEPLGQGVLGVLGLAFGIGFGIFAWRQAYNYNLKSDQTFRQIIHATDDLKKTSVDIRETSNDIAEHLRYKIINIGQAVAIAYDIIHTAWEACRRRDDSGDDVDIELYYINIVCSFGRVHRINPNVVEIYDKTRQIDMEYNDLIVYFPTLLRDLSAVCDTKIVLLDPEALPVKFFDQLKKQSPYSEKAPFLEECHEFELARRNEIKKGAVLASTYVPFQMIGLRVSREGRTESACSLVLAVGTGTIGKALSERSDNREADSAHANGYYTQDSHYAEINIEIAKAIWHNTLERQP